jgi:hypothetical protein
MMKAVRFLPLFFLAVACGPAYIDGTTVLDNPSNRELVETVETYRQAVEERDVEALAQIVSRAYFENSSTTGVSEDDYGYEELLRKTMPILRDNIKKVVYRVKVEGVKVDGARASVFVDFDLQCQYIEGGLEGWSTAKDRNRLDFVLEDGKWKIIAGL